MKYYPFIGPAKMYVYWYEQVNKTTGEVRHMNLGKAFCKNPIQSDKWYRMKKLEERCRTETPWLVRAIGAMPIDMYEGHVGADPNQPVLMKNYGLT